MDPKHIIVIGTSAGGFTALDELVSQLTLEMQASFFIVMHLSKTGISDYLAKRLQPLTPLRCMVGKDATQIEANHIYVAPPNEHMIVIKDQIVVGHGPEENRWRPSIDVLFRSAAAAYNAQVIGIILTGLLADGTAGMIAIKKSGGVCVVQDPNEAEFPDMPLNVLNSLEADYCTSLANMGSVITGIVAQEPREATAPPDVIAEANIAEKMLVSLDHVKNLVGLHSVYACPDCGGGLWEIKEGNIIRYRCHVGHSYEEKELLIKQAENVEATLWVALRMMEERNNLYSRIATEHKKKGLTRIAATYQKSADEIKGHINILKDVLIAIQKQQQIQS